ncbi:MAG: serine/threonine-protein kinase, partial [Actinomycetota bacterium]
LAMELVDGLSLEEYVQIHGPLRGGMLWAIAEGLVEALTSIHAAGVIHRDLKPSNIIIGTDGLKVVDFGISALKDSAALTGTGGFVGTAAWLSPEQVSGGNVTAASDIFNFGLVMTFAACGEHPFGTGRADAIMYRIAHDEPNLQAVPEGLRAIVASCLSKTSPLRPTLSTISALLTGADRGHVSSPTGGEELRASTRMVSQTRIEQSFRDSSGQLAPPRLPTNQSNLEQSHESALSTSVGSSSGKNRSQVMIAAAVIAVVVVIAGIVVAQRSSDSNDAIDITPTTETTNSINQSGVGATVDIAKVGSEFDAKFVKLAVDRLNTDGAGEFADVEERTQDTAGGFFMYGAQLDCAGFYPIRELTSADTARSIWEGDFSNYLAGTDYEDSYLIVSAHVTVFTGFNQGPNSFSDRAISVLNKIPGGVCDDRDLYYAADVPQLKNCLSKMFAEGSWVLSELNDVCAKDALKTVSWNTDSKSEKVFVQITNAEDSPHGRAGDSFTIGVFPVGEEAKYANFLVGVVVVWEEENVGLVVIVSGQNSTNKFDNGSEKLKEAVINAMASIGEEATTLIEGSLKP